MEVEIENSRNSRDTGVYTTGASTGAAYMQRGSQRSAFFPYVSWGAIFAGVASGVATYILLTLLGIAIGMTAIEPQAAEPVGAVPLGTGIWTGISLLIGAFVGGYVAAWMSGLHRRSDGVLHGLVSWGVTTLLYVWLATTAVGAIVGGTFGVLGGGLQAASNVAGEAATEVSPGQASEIANQGEQALQQGQQGLQQLPQQASEVAEQVVPALTAAAWWLFIGLLLSMLLGIWGGALGAHSAARKSHPA